MKVSFNSNIYENKLSFKGRVSAVQTRAVTNPIKIAAGFASAACLSGQVAVNLSKSKSTISDVEFEEMLKKNKYEKNDNNEYKKKYSDEEKTEIWTSYDGHVNHRNVLIQGNIKQDEMKGFKEFLELANGKALKYTETHFDDLMVSYLALKRGNIFDKHKEIVKQNSGYQDLVLNTVIKPIKIVESNVLQGYKSTDYTHINKYLRYITHHDNYNSDELQQKSEVISKYIDTQTVETPIKVYRNENSNILKYFKTSDGEKFDLQEKLSRIENSEKREEEIKELNAYISKNDIRALQSGFLSTSLNSNISDLFVTRGRIDWELDVPNGTKGVYIEPIVRNGCLSYENEFLLQKNSEIKLHSIDYDREKSRWKIKGEILN